MTKNKTKFFIQTEQVDPEGSEKMELKTEGLMWRKDNTIFLQYNETSITGFPGSVMTLEISGETVFITRTGKFSASMIVEGSKEHYGYYVTPMGNMNVLTRGIYVSNELTEDGVKISMKYGVYMNGVFVNMTTININADIIQ